MNKTDLKAAFLCDKQRWEILFGRYQILVSDSSQRVRVSAHYDDDASKLYVVFGYDPIEPSVAAATDYGIHEDTFKIYEGIGASLAKQLLEFEAQLRMDYPEEDFSVVYTGHGYGGGLAMLFSGVIKPHELVTFGQPPILEDSQGFVSQYPSYAEVGYTRYVIAGDTSTRERLFGFKHLGQVEVLCLPGEPAEEAVMFNVGYLRRCWQDWLAPSLQHTAAQYSTWVQYLELRERL